MAEDKIFLHRFWDMYPDADAIPAFHTLRVKKGEEASSRIMWYIRFLNDPEHEYVHKLPMKDREELLKGYCEMKKPDLTSQLFKDAETWYKDNYMSVVKQGFVAIGEKVLQARDAIRSGTIYAPEDIATYTAALKSYKELASEYATSLAALNSELKNNKAGKLFGKDKYVNPADDGSLFQKEE